MEQIEVLELDEKPKKKRKLKLWVKLLLIIIIILFGTLIFFNYQLSSLSKKDEIIEFKVDKGLTVDLVGKKLAKEKIIRDFNAYKIYVRLTNVKGYKTGIYKLNKKYSTKKIVSILSGNNYHEESIVITFKEGKTIRSIAKELAKKTSITETQFYEKLNDEVFINKLIDKYWFLTDDIKNKDIYYSLEGYLYPETYFFSKDVAVEQVIETMLDQSNKVFSKYKSEIDASGKSINEIVTLASIIESEGIYEEDRKMISGVFYNRLKSGMPLGSDVTTYYAFKVDLGERDLTKAEINTYNPYNTRGPLMNGKLPVGPISNFSETSFAAALNPTNNDYYYFVADKKGKTHFTKTYEEHLKIISELKKQGNWIEW